ncbi:MAG: translation initiation factor IF-2 [Deltaproteobacteria bacterium]|nr:translation initiation factor IF-2 [Deltaproteobacteria bacterium]
MNKVRVYEVARDLGLTNKDVVALFQSLGFSEVKNHMSAVEPEAVERVKRKLERKGEDDKKVVEQRMGAGVIKRRAKQEPAKGADAAEAVDAPRASSAGVAAPPAEPEPPRASQSGARPSTPGARPSAPAARASSSGKAEPEARVSQRGRPPAEVEVEVPAPRASQRARKAAASQPSLAAPLVPSFDGPTSVAPESLTPPTLRAEDVPKPVVATSVAVEVASPSARVVTEAPRSTAAPSPSQFPERRPSQPPKSGIEVWEGRPGVPMPQRPRTPAGPASGPPRRTTYDPRANQPGGPRPYGGTAPTGYGQRPMPGRPMRPGFGRKPPFGRPGPMSGRRPEVSTKEMSAHKMVIRIEGETSLQSLAQKMALKAIDVLMKLLSMGMTGVNINSTLDSDTAKLLASEFGWTVEDVSVNVDEQLEQAVQQQDEGDAGDEAPRPPIVTVMGHVDHGKTSLLDTIRRTQIASGEAGGITQHIGAYRVEKNGRSLCFLDTPGHEAFTAMRSRGASLTDIVVLVVAADDGVMPQTKEAISHARAAKVPIIVAINKIDKPGAEPERVLRELANEGLQSEDWGGDTIMVRLSAKTGEGVDTLLEMIQLQSEVLELRCHPGRRASGVVIEALLDRGRGSVARVLVQDGTLRRGDVLLAGIAYGKIRAMTDEKGRMLKEAGPSTPIEVLGLDEVPSAGDPVHAVKDVKAAEALADERRKKLNKQKATIGEGGFTFDKLREKLAEAEQLELKVILKADVQGSAEALAQALAKLSTKKVKLSIVQTGVGGITESDVNLAVAAQAMIVGFNVRPAGKAKKLAEQEKVETRLYSIIYEVIDDVRSAMEALLPATKVEKEIGKAEVRAVFRISKVGAIAGCMITDGVVKRGCQARLVRDRDVIWSGSVGTLKRFKDDAREVREGFECGIGLDGFNEFQEGDIIRAFELEEVKAKLDD